MNPEIIITTLAREADVDDKDDTFSYQGICYKKLMRWDRFDLLLSEFP
jgi:hypothetical protein